MTYIDTDDVPERAYEISDIHTHEVAVDQVLSGAEDARFCLENDVNLHEILSAMVGVASDVLTDFLVERPTLTPHVVERAQQVLQANVSLRQRLASAATEVRTIGRYSAVFAAAMDRDLLTEDQIDLVGSLLVRYAEAVAEVAAVWSAIADEA